MILVGDGEWDGLLEWLRERALADGRIDAGDLDAPCTSSQRRREVCEIVDAARAPARHGRHAPPPARVSDGRPSG